MSDTPKTKKKSTGRKCSICSHKDVDKINSQIAKGASFRHIASQTDTHYRSISRHVENCLNLGIATVQQLIKEEKAIDHNAELTKMFKRAEKYQKAAEKWLADPDNPEEYTIAPRADEIDIIYTVFDDDGLPSRNKLQLQKILDMIGGKYPDWRIETVFVKSADLRDYALKSLDRLDMVLDKIAKVQGKYQTERRNENDLTPEERAKIFYNSLVEDGLLPETAIFYTKKEFDLPEFTVKEEFVN